MKKKFVICLLAVIYAMLLMGCSTFHWRGKIPNYEEKTYTAANSEKIHNILLDISDSPVEIYNSEDENIYFSYFLADDRSNQYEIEEKDGVLTVTNICKPNLGIFVFGDTAESDSYKSVKSTLFIPYGYTGDLSVKAHDENITMNDIFVGSMNIQTTDGDVFFEDTQIKEQLSCKTKDGNILGTLAGSLEECNFKTRTSDSEQTLYSNNAGSKVVDLSTTDGDIRVSFEQQSAP